MSFDVLVGFLFVFILCIPEVLGVVLMALSLRGDNFHHPARGEKGDC